MSYITSHLLFGRALLTACCCAPLGTTLLDGTDVTHPSEGYYAAPPKSLDRPNWLEQPVRHISPEQVASQPQQRRAKGGCGWNLENYGVTPNIPVVLAPHESRANSKCLKSEKRAAGCDRQLQTAIYEALLRLRQLQQQTPDSASKSTFCLSRSKGKSTNMGANFLELVAMAMDEGPSQIRRSLK